MISKVFQIILGVLLAFLLVEGVLRVVSNRRYDTQRIDPATGLLTYVPGISYKTESPCFENTIEINNLGFHAQQFEPKKPGTKRIVMLGGSFIEALQLPVQETVAAMLEKNVHVEVYPVAMSGNTTRRARAYLQAYGKELQPDVVINFATEYEAEHGTDTNENAIQDSKPIAFLKSVQKKSRLLMALYFRRAAVENRLRADEETNESSSKISWSREQVDLKNLASDIRALHAKSVYVTWMTPNAQSAGTAFADASRVAGFDRYIDLSPGIAARAKETGENPVWACDNHWNARGHEWAADLIAEQLRSDKKLGL